MGRYVSLALEPTVYFGVRDVKPGYGSGVFRFYGSSGSFLVPLGVTEVRVTALGGGGCGSCFCQCCCCCRCTIYLGSGGGGAGYIVATVPVTPGCTCNIAVGSAGGASCFGTVVYAYGGCHASVTSSSTTAGAGGNFCACAGSTLVVGYNGNAGCTNGSRGQYEQFCACSNSTCDQWGGSCSYGGASGSPIGGGGTGPFPGTLGTDVYSCKGFNGEASTETDVASKFSNTIRWPGETIMSTSRLATSVGGTAAQFPPNTYCVSVFGGGGLAQCSCLPYACAGCGGGRAGAVPCVWCYCSSGYQNYSFMPNGPNYSVCGVCAGFPGNGFVVVEY